MTSSSLTNGLERRLTAISKATRDLAPTTPGTPEADIVLAAAAERLEAAFQAAFPGIERDDSTTTISGPQSTFAAGEQDAARLNLGRPLAAPEQSAATLALPSS